MITVYELKNRPTCRFFYKIPYFVKNCALLVLMMAILIPIYFAHFRKESLGYHTIYKLLLGLNSKTFNYLQANAEQHLNIKQEGAKILSATNINLRDFYKHCVSQSRICKIPQYASAWKASQEWNYDKNPEGYKNLAKKIGDEEVAVYVDSDATTEYDNFSSFSFRPDSVNVMKFKNQFLPEMTNKPVGFTMRDSSISLRKKIESDIMYPEFYHEYAQFESLELTVGQSFIDNVHYKRQDQIMCVVDGHVDIALVPHVYRQEMQPGTSTSYKHPIKGHEMIVELDVNESPVNLLTTPDFEKFPTAKGIYHFYEDRLDAGDCYYIPAFYFYQIKGESYYQPQKGDSKSAAITVTFKYKAHSRMLEAFYDAIEAGILN